MSLFKQLEQRASAGRPIRVALIGAGKFGSMYLSQIPRTPGIHLVGIADLSPDRARASLRRVGWDDVQFAAGSVGEALQKGSTFITDDASGLIGNDAVEIIIEATGVPAAGIHHALRSIEHGKHVIMVNVEADVLAGPYLAKRAAQAGVIYSMASGDQPALIAELVDWARTIGLEVVCAGKGTKYLPIYHASTPVTVWGHYGFNEEQVAAGDFNAQMFNSFLDGTKSALEMAAVANACELHVPANGLGFPPCGVDDLPSLLKPVDAGGILPHKGMVEVVSSIERDGRPVFRDLRWGVYAVFEAPTDYVRDCFLQYGLKTDVSGRYAAMYKPYHLIGLELGISVATVALRNEATGATGAFVGDVVASAKRDLHAGEFLDGEGGFTVYGKLLPAAESLRLHALPIGLAHRLRLKRSVQSGCIVSWNDLEFDDNQEAIRVRRLMESEYRSST